LAFFETFVQSTLVLSWIKSGFPLRWNASGAPPSKRLSNHSSALQHPDVVTANIKKIILSGAAQAVNYTPHVVSPLGIVFQKDKSRLIFDGRYLNSFLVLPLSNTKIWVFATNICSRMILCSLTIYQMVTTTWTYQQNFLLTLVLNGKANFMFLLLFLLVWLQLVGPSLSSQGNLYTNGEGKASGALLI
jgi:hypothetical protein